MKTLSKIALLLVLAIAMFISSCAGGYFVYSQPVEPVYEAAFSALFRCNMDRWRLDLEWRQLRLCTRALGPPERRARIRSGHMGT